MRKVMRYTQDIELKMQRLYASLSEKDRRRYAAIEVAKRHGGTEPKNDSARNVGAGFNLKTAIEP